MVPVFGWSLVSHRYHHQNYKYRRRNKGHSPINPEKDHWRTRSLLSNRFDALSTADCSPTVRLSTSTTLTTTAKKRKSLNSRPSAKRTKGHSCTDAISGATNIPLQFVTATPLARSAPLHSVTATPLARSAPLQFVTATPIARSAPLQSVTATPLARSATPQSYTATPLARSAPLQPVTATHFARSAPRTHHLCESPINPSSTLFAPTVTSDRQTEPDLFLGLIGTQFEFGTQNMTSSFEHSKCQRRRFAKSEKYRAKRYAVCEFGCQTPLEHRFGVVRPAGRPREHLL